MSINEKCEMNPEALIVFFHAFSFHVHLASHASTDSELISAFQASIINTIFTGKTRLFYITRAL